jgi:hypothetical protein
MKTQLSTSVLSGVALSLAALQATAGNQGDEFVTTTADAETIEEAYTGTWYYDEEYDTIFLNVPGSRSKYLEVSQTRRADTPAREQNLSWYHDEEYDTIVLNVPGSRSKYLKASQTGHSESPVLEQNLSWYYDEEYDTAVVSNP